MQDEYIGLHVVEVVWLVYSGSVRLVVELRASRKPRDWTRDHCNLFTNLQQWIQCSFGPVNGVVANDQDVCSSLVEQRAKSMSVETVG